MKRLLTSAALALVLTSPTLAENQPEMKVYTAEQKGDFYAGDFIGTGVYNSKMEWNENYFTRDGWEKEWTQVGEIENVILNQKGSVKAVILEIGGFLGIGDKEVAIPMEKLSIIRSEDMWSNYFVAIRATEEELSALPAYERATPKQMNEMYSQDAAFMLVAPVVTFAQFERVEPRELTPTIAASKIEGKTAYDENNKSVGDVEQVLLKDGRVEGFVIDVGGWLGIGEKPIKVDYNQVTLLQDPETDEFRVYIDSEKQKLENMPRYSG